MSPYPDTPRLIYIRVKGRLYEVVYHGYNIRKVIYHMSPESSSPSWEVDFQSLPEDVQERILYHISS